MPDDGADRQMAENSPKARRDMRHGTQRRRHKVHNPATGAHTQKSAESGVRHGEGQRRGHGARTDAQRRHLLLLQRADAASTACRRDKSQRRGARTARRRLPHPTGRAQASETGRRRTRPDFRGRQRIHTCRNHRQSIKAQTTEQKQRLSTLRLTAVAYRYANRYIILNLPKNQLSAFYV